eukprot:TRINITY_DN8428_c0_g1_i2.p1 TRINITY_DN8428_c0_g1~~TRINITY_DN8428_c0_g1_i2.p1  ORF type:complete len:558 (+),score=118.95 TRINITY_DN8428_c0_g1_i2:207-1676(+)
MKDYMSTYREENKEAIQETVEKWRTANQSKLQAYHSKYRQENKDRITEIRKQYEKTNADKIARRKKKYYEENKDRITEIRKQYEKTNADKIARRKKKYYEENKLVLREKAQSKRTERRAKQRIYMRNYRAINKEKVAIWNKEYREKHRERLGMKDKNYRNKNREAILEYARTYRQHNKEKAAKQWKEYYSRNKELKKQQWKLYYLLHRERLVPRKKELKLDQKHRIETYLQQNREHLKSELSRLVSINDPSDWYNVDIAKYKNDHAVFSTIRKLPLPRVLQLLYPDYEWKNWKFKNTPRNTWNDQKNVQQLLDDIAVKLSVTHINHWTRISRKQINRVGGVGLWSHFSSLREALAFAYPNISLPSVAAFRKNKRSKQRWLGLKASEILESKDYEENYQHPDLVWKNSRANIELDLWFPHLKMAFEYQGEQHYHQYVDVFGLGSELQSYLERDNYKLQASKDIGITTITVPYWWDEELDSLRDIIKELQN